MTTDSPTRINRLSCPYEKKNAHFFHIPLCARVPFSVVCPSPFWGSQRLYHSLYLQPIYLSVVRPALPGPCPCYRTARGPVNDRVPILRTSPRSMGARLRARWRSIVLDVFGARMFRAPHTRRHNAGHRHFPVEHAQKPHLRCYGPRRFSPSYLTGTPTKISIPCLASEVFEQTPVFRHSERDRAIRKAANLRHALFQEYRQLQDLIRPGSSVRTSAYARSQSV